MSYVILSWLTLLAPLAALVWFVTSLVLFLRTPKDSPKRSVRRSLLIASSVVIGVILLAIIALIIVFTFAVSFM